MAMLVGCGGRTGWSLAIQNDAGAALVVRIDAGKTQSAWLVQDQDALVVFEMAAPVHGTMYLVDPSTCDVLDQRAIPSGDSIVLLEVDGSAPGAYAMYPHADRLTNTPVSPSNFQRCDTAPEPTLGLGATHLFLPLA
jgi:hypothetical protein